jgi:hypothetical protein
MCPGRHPRCGQGYSATSRARCSLNSATSVSSARLQISIQRCRISLRRTFYICGEGVAEVVTELLDFSGADGDADRSAARCPTLNTIYRRDALASALQSDQGPVNLAFLFSTNLKSSPQAQCKQEMQRHLFGAPPRATPAARSASSCCTARPGRSRGRAEPGFVPVTPARVSKYPPPSRRTVVASTFYKAVIFYISCVNGVDATNNGPVLGFDRRSVPQQPGRLTLTLSGTRRKFSAFK